MKKWQFVAIDVDGTLLDNNDHYDVSRFNNILRQLTAKGIHFIVASGNSLDALHAIFAASPLVKNYVAENGGRIIRAGHEEFSRVHDRSTLAHLLTWERTLQTQPDLFSFSGATRTFIPRQYKDIPVPYYPHHAYFGDLAEINEPIFNFNLNWFKQRPALDRIMDQVGQINKSFPQVHATYSGSFGIDVLPAGVNKAVSLDRLINQLGGRMSDLVAFGDTANDLEMIQHAGCGYAMKNATTDLLAVADRVTSYDNNHDGLLYELEQLFALPHPQLK
ncbi:HAD-IIB family hydrolase [Limosilactobacillus sp.]|uniref:HAD-IIB family hydrolase n=1 Tax=Limosilactobacillus sp. TaxID=2773925 RepID=UPI003F054943